MTLRFTYEPDPLYSFPGEFWNYRRMVRREECPHLLTPEKLQERENILEHYGRRSAFAASMVFGEFQPSADGNNIFLEYHVEQLRAAMTRRLPVVAGGDVRAAADSSGGGDGQVLMIRRGLQILLLDTTRRPTDIEQAEYWVGLLKRLGIPPWQFTLDGGGAGATIGNYMELRLGYLGINRFLANNKPIFDYQYHDRYTELHFMMRELFPFMSLPFNQKLLTQCRDRLFVEMGKDVVKAEPKREHRKRMNYSPDELDTLVYLFQDFPIEQFRRTQEVQAPLDDTTRPDSDPLTEWERKILEGAPEGAPAPESPFGFLQDEEIRGFLG